MLTLAKYALKGPYQAALVTGMLAIVAVFLPLLTGQSLVSAITTTILIVMAGAMVGLIILTHGVRSGMKAVIASVFGITLVTTLVLKNPAMGLSIGLMQWLPIVILAQALKVTRSLAAMILTGLIMAVVAIAIQYLAWPDLEASLLPVFQQSFIKLADDPAISSELVNEYTQLLAHWMVILLVAMMYMLFVMILLLSRWMQGKIANSDGYKKEFHAIALGKPAAAAGLVIVLLSGWLNQDWITSIAMAVVVAFLYQGIAVLHSKLANNKHKALIMGMYYALLLIFPQVVAVSSIVGVIDNWLIFRKNRNIEST